MCIVRTFSACSPGLVFLQIEKRSQQQSCAGQQHEGQSDFRNHQAHREEPARHRGARARPATPRAAAMAGARPNPIPVAMQTAKQEREYPPVQPDFPGSRNLRPPQFATSRRVPKFRSPALRCRRRGQQEALRQKLSHQPQAARADRRSNGDLAGASGSASQQQIRHVQARHQQHHARRRRAAPAGLSRRAAHHILQRSDTHNAVALRMALPWR